MQKQEPIRKVAVYGQQKGINKRWQLSGTEEELTSELRTVVLHPPKGRFLTNPKFKEQYLSKKHTKPLKASTIRRVVLGDRDKETVGLDWDDTALAEVKLCSLSLSMVQTGRIHNFEVKHEKLRCQTKEENRLQFQER